MLCIATDTTLQSSYTERESGTQTHTSGTTHWHCDTDLQGGYKNLLAKLRQNAWVFFFGTYDRTNSFRMETYTHRIFFKIFVKSTRNQIVFTVFFIELEPNGHPFGSKSI